MADTTFIDRSTPIVASWLNDVNAITYGIPSTVSGKGTSLVGSSDDGNFYQTTTAEGQLQEIGANVGHVLPVSGGDDSSALQALVTSLVATGGTIKFRQGARYRLSSQVTISSLYPINLIGEEGGLIWNVAGSMPCIEIGATIVGSAILYTAPNSGSRAQHGGGVVRGLAFIDPTGSGGTPGTRSVTAALELNDFACSKVDGCVFQWINGSAIKGEFVVMSDITNNIVRYCGDTSKPALNFPSTSATFPAQSTNIVGNRVEVCNDAAYLSLGANSLSCKIALNGFEADTANAATNQEFLTLAGTGCSVVGNHFSRNTGSQITVSGTGNTMTGNVFAGGAYATTAVTVSGARNSVSGNTFRSSRTGFEVDITGRANLLANNQFYASGAVKASGATCSISNNSFDQMTCTSAALGAGNEWWISLESTATASLVSGNTLNNNGGSVTDVGGIRVKNTMPVVHGNVGNAFAGTSNGAIFIKTETSNAVVSGNAEANTTTFISASTSPTNGDYRGNVAVTSTAVQPLSGSTTWDPANIAAGASTTTTVAVTGAAVGDYVIPSFSLSLAGTVLTAYVSGANTVTAVLSNPTAGAVDLASGTLKVRVEKR